MGKKWIMLDVPVLWLGRRFASPRTWRGSPGGIWALAMAYWLGRNYPRQSRNLSHKGTQNKIGNAGNQENIPDYTFPSMFGRFFDIFELSMGGELLVSVANVRKALFQKIITPAGCCTWGCCFKNSAKKRNKVTKFRQINDWKKHWVKTFYGYSKKQASTQTMQLPKSSDELRVNHYLG